MKKTLLYSVLLLFITLNVQAQTPQFAYTGPTSSGNAINLGPPPTWGNYKSQWLYLPGDLAGLGTSPGFITAVYFRSYSNYPASTYSDFTVSLGNTSTTSLTGTFITGLNVGLPATTFNVPATAPNQWIHIPLQNMVYFDPTQPLVVEITQTNVSGGIYLCAGGVPVNPAYTGNTQTYGAPATATSGSARRYSYQFGIDFFAGYPCVDTPKTEIGAATKVCSKDSFVITPVKYYANATYQYQYSKDGKTWSNFTGIADILGRVKDAIDEPKWYRCKIFCNANPNAYYISKPIYIDIAPFYYCYCKNKATDTKGLDIGNFNIVAKPSDAIVLNNGDNGGLGIFPNTTAKNTYTAFMDEVAPAILYRDSTYEFNIGIINSENNFPSGFAAIYLDWNRDGLYDEATERIMHEATDNDARASEQYTIPSNAEIGLTGMRAILAKNSPVPACGNYAEGETEDYLADISWEPCSGPVNAGILSGDSSVCVGYDFLITNSDYETRKSAFTRNWQISGDNKSWFYIKDSKDKSNTGGIFNGQPVYYRVEAICSPSKDTTYTDPFRMNLKEGYKCYCFSQAVGGNEKDSSDIGGFTLASINHQEGSTHLQNPQAIRKRTDFTDNMPVEIDIDSAYEVKIFHTQRTDIHGDAKITVFMDFNNNHQYDIPEDRVFMGYTSVGNFTLVDSLVVNPQAILNVPTGMRVILNNDISPNKQSDSACGVFTSGETEDFMIMFRKKGITGIGTVAELTGMGLYPNPSTGKFTVQYNGAATTGEVQLIITNVLGQQVHHEHYATGNGKLNKEIDLSSQPKGVYTVEINSGTEKTTQKLVLK